MTTYQQKITFGEMRESGVRDVLIYCRDHRCSHHVETNADGWPDDVRLSDIEPKLHLHQVRQAWRGYQAELSAGEDGDCLRSYLHCCRKLRTASPEPRAGTAIGAGSPSKTILISFCALAIIDINLTDQMDV